MGVVATQHIREEYDEEDDDDDEDDDEEIDEEDQEYGAEEIDIDVESTPPVNEGGGPSQSTGVQNSYNAQ